jgi:hypothetical protein
MKQNRKKSAYSQGYYDAIGGRDCRPPDGMTTPQCHAYHRGYCHGLSDVRAAMAACHELQGACHV